MGNFLIVAQQVAILFVLMGVGFACRKTKLIDDSSIKGFVNLLILIVTPSLIMDCFQREYDPSMLSSLGIGFLVAIIAHFVVIGMAYAFVRHWADGTERVLRVAAVFSNAGFMGIPLEQAIFGDVGAFYGIIYVVVFNLFMWSWGLWVMGGKMKPVAMFVNPGTIGIILGLPLFFFSIHLPQVVHTPIHYIAGLNTPLAMVVIGYYLAGARLGAAIRMKMTILAAAIRLVIYPLLLTLAMYPFRHLLDRTMLLALITAASAPVAAMVSMFAAKYDRDIDVSVGIVSGTTLLSIVTMPIVIAIAMSVL